MNIEELKNSLLAAPKNGYARLSAQEREEMEAHARGYAAFIDACKTEREAVAWSVKLLKKHGFVELVPGMELKPGDKVYRNVHNKALMAAVIGSESMNTGARICAAHIDSPRMDLKPNPLYEDAGMAYLKTHYYGGIKKYQWVTVPLALHGVVVRKDGTSVTITIGEDENDPILMITDLLPHLAADQMQKTAANVIAGEQLNVLLGSEPLEGEGSDLVKLHMMKLLNDKYGITERDLMSAEISIVPAMKARDLGLDRALIASLGTGSACVYAEKNGGIEYLGGTGVGGGTLVGLSKKMLNMDNVEHISVLAATGSLDNIDLKIKDITKADILPGFGDIMTASNFGSVSDLATREDIALGIINMVFETIGMISIFGARNYNLRDIVLTGNLSAVAQAPQVFDTLNKMFDMNFIIPANSSFGTVIGAALMGCPQRAF